MSEENKLKELATGLDGATTDSGFKLSAEIIAGEVDVLMVFVEDREEFPIYVTVDESQTLCISHLWTEAEVEQSRRMDLLDTLLTMNIPMPLSSFSKVGSQYLIFGALSNTCSLEQVVEEISVLSDNTLTAVEELSEFLTKQG